VDHRFKVAVPVYGCGFLHENSVWKDGILDKMDGGLRERWVRLFDPSQYLPNVRCPILFLNGTNDFAYPLDSYKKCFDLVHAPKRLSVQIRLPHGHIWTYSIVDHFVDSKLTGGPSLPALDRTRVSRGMVEARVRSTSTLSKAELYYTADEGKWLERRWQAIPARLDGGRVVADLPQGRLLVCILAVTDSNGNILTTPPEVVAKRHTARASNPSARLDKP